MMRAFAFAPSLVKAESGRGSQRDSLGQMNGWEGAGQKGALAFHFPVGFLTRHRTCRSVQRGGENGRELVAGDGGAMGEAAALTSI